MLDNKSFSHPEDTEQISAFFDQLSELRLRFKEVTFSVIRTDNQLKIYILTRPFASDDIDTRNKCYQLVAEARQAVRNLYGEFFPVSNDNLDEFVSEDTEAQRVLDEAKEVLTNIQCLRQNMVDLDTGSTPDLLLYRASFERPIK